MRDRTPFRRGPQFSTLLFGLMLWGLMPFSATAQKGEPQGQVVPYHFDSGAQRNASSESQVLADHLVVMAPEVPWLRLLFAEAKLGPGSVIRVTSVLDGEVQTLNARELRRWRNATAFFNGSAVRLELIAGPRTDNHVRIQEVLIGKPPAGDETRSICGLDDNRVPSSHPAVTRLLDAAGIPCTGFIVDCPDNGADKCHLSAGHCFVPGDEAIVAEFNVPASNAACGLQHPPVAKQFPIDPDSIVREENGVGHDWAVFRCLENSAGKTTFEEQGSAFSLADNVPTSGTVRVTGYGADGNEGATGGANNACACNPNASTGARHSIQQTHTGPLVVGDAGQVDYQADDCGGNSGSPIIFESTGRVIGIQTHGGCDSGGENSGTEITLTALQDALKKCDPQMLVLLDRTGSMLETRSSTGKSRCHDALALAKQDVTSFFATNSQAKGSSVAVWTFADNAPTNLTGGFGNETAALAALNALSPEGCGGSTPLAESLCDAGNTLSQTFPSAGKRGRILAVSSDGGENNSDGPCSGPDSNSGPPYDPGSWQQKTTDQLEDQSIVLARFWGSVTNAPDFDRETGRPVTRAVSDHDFFEHLAQVTGGLYQPVQDSDPLPPPFFGGQTSILEIPTLSSWGLISFVLALGCVAYFILRRSRRTSGG